MHDIVEEGANVSCNSYYIIHCFVLFSWAKKKKKKKRFWKSWHQNHLNLTFVIDVKNSKCARIKAGLDPNMKTGKN